MDVNRIGRYVILRPLGRGAMGVVYLAQDPQIERTIALKTIRFDTPGSSLNLEEAKARFLKEARISGRLQHPNIVTVFDVGEDGGNLFLAMEFVSGGSFAQRIADFAEVPLVDRVRIVAEVADALAHAHERGVIHRDIKPANILLTDTLSAKVTDFGIGKLLSGDTDLTSTGQMVGSPAYMSPEQIRGEKLDVRSDVFSLGVVLYQALTARKPFPADTLTTLVYQILHEEPADPAALNADLPPDLSEIARRCLAKRREDRYADAAALAEDLRAVIGISPVSSTANLSESKVRRARAAALGDSSGVGRSGAAAPPLVPPVMGTATQPTVQIGAPPLPPSAGRGPGASGAVPEEPTVVVASDRRPSPVATGGADGAGRTRLVAAIGVLVAGIAAVFGYRYFWPVSGGETQPTPGPVAASPTPAPPTPIAVATLETPSPAPTATAAPETTPIPTETIQVFETPLVTRTPVKRTRTTPTSTETPPPAVKPPTATPVPREADLSITVRRRLKVNVSPSQARVFLDGLYIGISDDWDDSGGGSLLAFLVEGRHRLRFAYPAKRDLLVEVLVSSRATEDEVELDTKMENGVPSGDTGPEGKFGGPDYKTVGPVRLAVEPPNAVLYIDGKEIGPASKYASENLMLPQMKVYELALSAPDHAPKYLRVIVSPVAGRPRAEIKEKLKRTR